MAKAKELRKKRNNDRKQEPGFSSINCFQCFPMYERVKDLSKFKHLDKEARSEIEQILKEVKA